MYCKEYQKKLVTAEEAVKTVKIRRLGRLRHLCRPSGCHGQGAGGTRRGTDGYQGPGRDHPVMPEILTIPNPEKRFTWNSWHCTGVDRRIIEMGCGFYSPMRYSELPKLYREKRGNRGCGHVPGGAHG